MAEQKKSTGHAEHTVPFLKGDWDKAVYLDNPHMDNMMSAMLSMGTEFWAMKRRQLVVEKLLETKKPITRAAIDAYNPTAEELKLWDAERDDFIERVFAVLTRNTDAPSRNG